MNVQDRLTSLGAAPVYDAEVVEATGVIKWFDPAKGYGFITFDNGLPDALLHVTCLRADGYQIAYKGARLCVQAMRGTKGLMVSKILSMDESAAIYPPVITRIRAPVVDESDWECAVVKWFNRVRGFGFLTRGEGTPDIFVHMETVRACKFTELRFEQAVWVRSGPSPKGLVATDLFPR